jgi:hypothetical protein
MTLRITDDFTLTRSGQHLVVEVFGAFPARVRLGLDDVRKAKEAFGMMAAMMESSNSCEPEEAEVLKLEDAA